MERFSNATDDLVNELKMKAKNTNTTKSTSNWLRVLNAWFDARKLNYDKLSELPHAALDRYLQCFLC